MKEGNDKKERIKSVASDDGSKCSWVVARDLQLTSQRLKGVPAHSDRVSSIRTTHPPVWTRQNNTDDMSQSPPPVAGPSTLGKNRPDGNMLRQFVEAYLQQHGFDKVLETFRTASNPDSKHANGDDDAAGESAAAAGGADGPGSKRRKGSASAQPGGREAILRAPGPVSLDNTIKRNIPQAQSLSTSLLSDRITPEFEAQAKYIIDAFMKKMEAAGGEDKPADPKGEILLDPSDRIEGYRRYRRWVDDMLDMWKVSLASQHTSLALAQK